MNRPFNNSINRFSLLSSAFLNLRSSSILSWSCTLSCSRLFSSNSLKASIIALFAFSALSSFVAFLFFGRRGCTAAVAEEGPGTSSADGSICVVTEEVPGRSSVTTAGVLGHSSSTAGVLG